MVHHNFAIIVGCKDNSINLYRLNVQKKLFELKGKDKNIVKPENKVKNIKKVQKNNYTISNMKKRFFANPNVEGISAITADESRIVVSEGNWIRVLDFDYR